MAIDFEIHEIPKSSSQLPEISKEKKKKIADNLVKINKRLRKRMFQISIKEYPQKRKK